MEGMGWALTHGHWDVGLGNLLLAQAPVEVRGDPYGS
jgi:hypothetical protein